MAAQDFYTLKEVEKNEIFTATAQQKGLPNYAVEKDWWVVWMKKAQTFQIYCQ